MAVSVALGRDGDRLFPSMGWTALRSRVTPAIAPDTELVGRFTRMPLTSTSASAAERSPAIRLLMTAVCPASLSNIGDRETVLLAGLGGAQHQLVAGAGGATRVDHFRAQFGADGAGLVVDLGSDRIERIGAGFDDEVIATDVDYETTAPEGTAGRCTTRTRMDLGFGELLDLDRVGARSCSAGGAGGDQILVGSDLHLQEVARCLQGLRAGLQLVEQPLEVVEERLLLVEVRLLGFERRDRTAFDGDERRDDRLRVEARRESPEAICA